MLVFRKILRKYLMDDLLLTTLGNPIVLLENSFRKKLDEKTAT